MYPLTGFWVHLLTVSGLKDIGYIEDMFDRVRVSFAERCGHFQGISQPSPVQRVPDVRGTEGVRQLHLFPANLGDSACISEIVQAISAVRQFGGRSGMIRQPQCRNWLHLYRITCRSSKNGRKKVYVTWSIFLMEPVIIWKDRMHFIMWWTGLKKKKYLVLLFRSKYHPQNTKVNKNKNATFRWKFIFGNINVSCVGNLIHSSIGTDQDSNRIN